MFDKKSKPIQEDIEEEPEIEPSETEAVFYEDEAENNREARLKEVIEERNNWDTSRLKPTTRRKKIGLACLVIGLVGYLILQYVVKG